MRFFFVLSLFEIVLESARSETIDRLAGPDTYGLRDVFYPRASELYTLSFLLIV